MHRKIKVGGNTTFIDKCTISVIEKCEGYKVIEEKPKLGLLT
jgi:hypothetical protein